MNRTDNKIKVLVVFAAVKIYGMERANISVFALLRDQGIDSLFVIGQWGLKEIAPELENQGLKYVTARFGGLIYKSQTLKEKLISIRDFFIGAIDLRKIIKEFKPHYIYIPNDLSFIMIFITLITNKIPLIFRLGDKPTDYKLHFRILWKYFITKRVTKFVVNSKFIMNELLKTGCVKEKVNLIYSYPPVRVSKIEKLSLPVIEKDGFVILYVGQFNENKGVHLLLDAAEILLNKYDDIYFIFAGDGDKQSKFYNEFINKINLIDNKNKIIFTGYVEDVDSLFGISSLHICPSIYDEPLANVVIEAKKNSVPSVIFKSGGLPELVEHLKDGYICEEKTTQELVKAIEYFYLKRNDLYNYKYEAFHSLNKLGITKTNFIKNWLEIFGCYK